MTRALTSAAADALRPGATRYEVPDGKVDGLKLIVQPTGKKTWSMRYSVAGESRRFTVGPYPSIGVAEARKLAMAARVKVAANVDPTKEKREARTAAKAAAIEEKKATEDLVETVVRRYMVEYCCKLDTAGRPEVKSHAEVDRILHKEFVAHWKGRRLSEITRDDIEARLEEIVERGARVAANRALAHFGGMVRWAVKRRILSSDITAGIEKPTKEAARERVLDDDELVAVWRAAEGLPAPYGSIARLLLLLGARRQEVSAMEWRELDLATKVWNLPSERSKNKRGIVIPLPDAAVAILQKQIRIEGSSYVFGVACPPHAWGMNLARLQNATALEKHWHLHDLRRSFASGLARLGTPPHVIEAALNHRSGIVSGIAAIYNRHHYLDERRGALDAWARHLEWLLAGKPAVNVVSLQAARG
ncbi:hypothetical protein AMST5_02998 [freshwater sediment metagenome]|uniref:Tyr recombinase domain-containing protein n=1 Tax=freshwater sediment metagenome TaxID=556182 RepID=A0AA48M161_9ZZZZ